MLEWETKLQEGEERLCQNRRHINEREEMLNERTRMLRQKESQIDEEQKKAELLDLNLKKKEEEVNKKLSELIEKEEVSFYIYRVFEILLLFKLLHMSNFGGHLCRRLKLSELI